MPAVKLWHLLPHDPDAIRCLASDLRISPIVAQLLLNRGLSDPTSARRFLDTPLAGLYQPSQLPGVSEAAERLLAAVRKGRVICIYGDYDVDGTTGTALLVQCLQLIGAARVDYYVPLRLQEGYGVNAEALRSIARSGVSVVVTVDCGIASVREAEVARELGLELIITDHHEPRETLPDAAVRIHPRLPDHSYPFDKLSGSGVAFKLAWALCQKACGSEKVTERYRNYLLDSVCLAALGTVADVVPLHDENRILVRHGLNRLRTAPSPGLRALMTAAGLGEGADVRAADIGYRLGPRLNAAGRLGCARIIVDLLTTTSPTKAAELAEFLEKRNADRQTLERRVVSDAREMIQKQGLQSAPALVLASEEWHGGVIGIAAGRLAEQYARPSLIIAIRRERSEEDPEREDVVGVGSGRSVAGFPLHQALRECHHLLLSHGGHQAAAGFRVRPDCIEEFREAFCAVAARHFPDGPPPPRLTIDVETPLSALTFGLMKEIDRLEPYGASNPRPVFLAGGLEVVGTPRRIGQGERHMSFRVQQNGTMMRAVAFGMGDRLDELMSEGGRCSLVFTPRINEWQGYRSVEIEVIDLQPGAQAKLG